MLAYWPHPYSYSLNCIINGNVAVTDQDKADALNTSLNIHFSNVFTKEDLVNIPVIVPVIDNIYPSFSIADIPIHGKAIYNKLCQLDMSKSVNLNLQDLMNGIPDF